MIDYDDLQRECDYNIEKLKRLFDLRIIDKNANSINNDMDNNSFAKKYFIIKYLSYIFSYYIKVSK